MNYTDFNTAANGFPVESDATFGRMQNDYQSAIRGLAAAFGADGVIVSGCLETSTTVGNGWLLLSGDLMRFEGGPKSANFFIEETVTAKTNQDGALIDRYFDRVAKFGEGANAQSWASLIRLESLYSLQQRLIDAFTPEPNLILAGCAVSDVNTGASTLSISAGSAIINRRIVVATPYTGGFPIYLNEVGEWVNTPPANGVRFDPHTAQRLPYALRRAATPVGEFMQRATLSDRIGSDGLGKWELSGWALADGRNGTVDMRSRFPVMYDPRTSDPGGNIWDAAYATPGTTGGEKKHTLSVAEMPAHRHGDDPIGTGEAGLIRRTNVGENYTIGSSLDAAGSGVQPDLLTEPLPIPLAGGGEAHENRPPFVVVVYLQRI